MRGVSTWLTDPGAEVAVLVTVAKTEGSVPRLPGARMLVTPSRLIDTIGGGHLELRASEIARQMLDGQLPPDVRLDRFPLGPSLGQCCGGVVHLVFEIIDGALSETLAALRTRVQLDSWRLSAIDGPSASLLCNAEGTLIGDGAAVPQFSRDNATHLLRDEQGRRWLVDPCLAPRARLVLFGAGHVGAAIVRALAELPCNITWVDERDELFPASVPANVMIEISDTPEAVVGAMPAGASYLVMTHSHALDQRLSEVIMERAGDGSVGWFGLIGSLTKRRQFEHRLLARGIPAGRFEQMTCPIGLPGITGKEPAVIAASVCAQLLMVWAAQQMARERQTLAAQPVTQTQIRLRQSAA